jgi:hypothetical protein
MYSQHWGLDPKLKKKNPGGARFSAPIQTGSWAHPASCTMGTGSFPGVKAAGTWCRLHPPPPSSAEVKKELSYTSIHPMGPPGPVTGFPLPFHVNKSRHAPRSIGDKRKDKVFLLHALKTYIDTTGIPPIILNLGIWWWVVNITPRLLYPRERRALRVGGSVKTQLS